MFQFLPSKDTSSQREEEDPKNQKIDSNKAYERYMNHYMVSQQPYGGMLSHESAAQLKAEGREITPSKYILTGTESSGANDEVLLKKNPIQRFVKEEGDEELRQRKVAQKSEEEEEEPLQAKIAQMAGMEKEEELMQGKFIQKQDSLEGEELMQGNFMQKKAEQENNSSAVSGGITTKMPEDVQAKMENSFGTDFNSVNIHTNAPAAKEMGALAYTQGNDISFANGQYNPSTQSGQELLGHELTHVVQQSEGYVQPTKQGKGMAINDSTALENEADRMGKNAAMGKNNTTARIPSYHSNTTSGNENFQFKLIQKNSVEPPLSKEDKKKYTYTTISGNLFTDLSGNIVNSADTTGKGIGIDDVNQGGIGDCYFLAAIGAIANSDPASLKNLIKDNKDGTYDVTLYVKENIFSSKRVPHVEKITSNFPARSNGNMAYAQPGKNNELWVMLLEKAFAQYKKGYKNIVGGYPGKAMQMLSGKKKSSYFTLFNKEEKIIKLIKDALNNSQAVTASSKAFKLSKKKQAEARTAGVISGHAYIIKGIDDVAKTIDLHNPWGSNHVIGLSISDFKKYYYGFQILD